MTEFNGWHMPLYYSGMTGEHLHTRGAAGLFDLCHMGRIRISGPRCRDFVDWLTPARLSAAKSGDVLYSFLLNEQGCPLDDITVYVFPDEYLLVVNAGNHDRDLAWIQDRASGFGAGVAVEDRSFTWGMIALQGPRAAGVMTDFAGGAVAGLGYYTFLAAEWNGAQVLYSATGYTGEHGYEIYLPSGNVKAAWERLLVLGADADVRPVGLGARDSLRLEAAMPLYGHELDDTMTPLEAGLGKFLDLDKPAFLGREALLALRDSGGPGHKLACAEMPGRGPVPRQGCPVHAAADGSRPVGAVTSGIFSPTLQKNVAMARVEAPLARVGTPLFIEIRGRLFPAATVKRPFYKRNP